jgi:hypothetical protein
LTETEDLSDTGGSSDDPQQPAYPPDKEEEVPDTSGAEGGLSDQPTDSEAVAEELEELLLEPFTITPFDIGVPLPGEEKVIVNF